MDVNVRAVALQFLILSCIKIQKYISGKAYAETYMNVS
uniref:Uncharacterized protein n=1 Tax=Arundo donax TaxID=35708 RepID=A0A0A9FEU5_ARUDO